MAAGAQIDYDALAQKHGAVSPDSGSVDYDALAKKHGAVPSASEKPEQAGFFESLGAGLPGYKKDDAFSAVKDAGSGLYHIFTHPVDSANLMYHGVVDPMQLTNEDAVARMKKAGVANKINGAIEYAESGVPFLGPQLAKAGQQIDQGNLAGGLGTTVGAAIPFVGPGAMETASATGKALLDAPLIESVKQAAAGKKQAAAEWIAGPVVRKTPTQTANDLKFGRSPAEAITREPGLEGVTVQGLRDGVHKRIGEIADATNNVLQNHPNANQPLNLEPIIDQAAKDAKNSSLAKLNPGLKDRIDGLAQNLKTEFGPLKKTPFDANQFKRDVGDATKWTGQAFDNEANQFLVDVYRGVKNKVNDAVPEVKTLNERQADLLSARAALDRRLSFDTNRALSPGRALLGAGGGALGSIVGGAAGGAGGAALGLAVDALRSTPSRLIAGKALGNKYPFPGVKANIPAAETEAGSGLISPLTGAPLASPEKLFKGGINTQGATASAGTMNPERSMQSLSSEIDTMKTRLRNAGGASAEEKGLLQKQIEDYQKRLDSLRARKAVNQ